MLNKLAAHPHLLTAALCASLLVGCGGEPTLASSQEALTCGTGQSAIQIYAAGLVGTDGQPPLMGLVVNGVVVAQYVVPTGVPAGTPLNASASTANVTYTEYPYCYPGSVSTSQVRVRLMNGGGGKALAVDKIKMNGGVPYETESQYTKSQGTIYCYSSSCGCTSLAVWRTEWLHCAGGEFRYGQW